MIRITSPKLLGAPNTGEAKTSAQLPYGWTDGRWIRMDLLELFVLAMVEHGLGNDKEALECLDAAAEIFGIDARKPKKRGRKRLVDTRDPDAVAIGLMEHMSKRTGVASAKKLARRVLRYPRYRRADKQNISESDVKRPADKWKAQRENKSD